MRQNNTFHTTVTLIMRCTGKRYVYLFFCIATSQSPSLIETLTTAYNLRMCLVALLMICILSTSEEEDIWE